MVAVAAVPTGLTLCDAYPFRSLQNGNRRVLYSGMKGKTKLQTNTINSGSLKTIFVISGH